jgi:hypothetical protein
MATHHKRAVLESWSQTKDWSARTKPARDARLRSYEKQVDPDGVMTPKDRAKAAKAAQRAHCLKMAEKSAKVRAARKRASS